MREIKIKWDDLIGEWYDREEIKSFLSTFYIKKLINFIDTRYHKSTVYPPRTKIFDAFRLLKPKNVKVVIVGQFPYSDGNATGIAFNNSPFNSRLSKSLVNILRRVEHDYNTIELDKDVTLSMWIDQGVLLLNSALTCEKGKPDAHLKPWNNFMKFMLKYIAENIPGAIFLLWGEEAHKFEKIDDISLSTNCHVLKAEDPSDTDQIQLWDCDHFKKVNQIIEKQNGTEYCIEW